MSQVEQPAVRSAVRRKRWHFLWNAAGLLVALIAVFSALWLWLNSHHFENLVRERIIAQLQAATGGRVEIRSFRWHLIDLEAEATGIVIHGLEDPGEAPYAQVESLRVRIGILGFFSPRIHLRELDVLKPQVHLVVYPDGSTNQPHPRTSTKPKKPVMETLFDLQAGHVSVQQGGFNFDSRASGFDSLQRYLPLQFDAHDVSVLMKYVPPAGQNPESYHVDAGVRDLNLLRGGQAPSASAFPAYLQASVDLTRDAAFVRSLRVTEHTRGEKQRVLNVSATFSDFTHLRWEGNASGEFDLHLLNPILGYPFTPEGVARLNLVAGGDLRDFHIDGPVHVDNGAYVAPGIDARRLQVDTRAHVDANLMHFGDVIVRFAQGGQVQGDLQLQHWRPHPLPQPVTISAAPPETKPGGPARSRHFWSRKKNAAPPSPARRRDVLVKNPKQEITVHGKIASKFENVALDTILDIVGQAPFNRLGIDTVLNGPATADWIDGDVNTLKVDALLGLAPSGRPIPGEFPGAGAIDASYSQHTGAVELRRLELNLPASRIQANGRLGAYPMTSPTALNVDLRSHNLGEFDTTLRALGLERNGKSGTAALPVSLSGEGEFHGTWEGSLISPRLAGTLKATQIAIELPPNPNAPSPAPQWVRWDSVDASGSYDAERIAVLHGRLIRGPEQISLDGTLSAPNAGSPGGSELPEFDSDSLLRAHVRAAKVDVHDLFPLLGIQEPVSGTLEVDFQIDGPLGRLGGSGWLRAR